MNKQIRRCTDVIRVLPAADDLLRLAESLLIECHDEWDVGDQCHFSSRSMLEQAVMNNRIEILDEVPIVPAFAASHLAGRLALLAGNRAALTGAGLEQPLEEREDEEEAEHFGSEENAEGADNQSRQPRAAERNPFAGQ